MFVDPLSQIMLNAVNEIGESCFCLYEEQDIVASKSI